MPDLTERTRLMAATMSPPAAARALADALAITADPLERNHFAQSILAHYPSNAGFLAVVAAADSLSPGTRRLALAAGPDFSAALRQSLDSRQETIRLSALRFIRERTDARCLDAVSFLLAPHAPGSPAATSRFTGAAAPSRHDETTAEAAETLLTITRAVIFNRPGDHHLTTNAARADLDRTLARTVDAFPFHRRTDVLLAAAEALARRGVWPALRAVLSDDGHPAHLAMRAAARGRHSDDDSPLLHLAIDSLASHSLQRIAAAAQSGDFPRLLRDSHLLNIPSIRSRLRRLDPRRLSAPDTLAALALDEELQSRLPVWLTAIPMDETARAHRLADGVNFSSPIARLASLRALVNMHAPAAEQAIASFCFDPEASIARFAARHVFSRIARASQTPAADSAPNRQSPSPAALAHKLLLSPHPEVRALVAAHATAADFDHAWRAWSLDPSAVDREFARAALSESRPAFVVELRRRLVSATPPLQHRALRLATDLDILAELELELLTAAFDPRTDPSVAATIIASLECVPSSSAREALDAATAHPDARVRANAVESLARRLHREGAPAPVVTLRRLAMSPDNRPRANAIRALLDVDRPSAATLLARMLEDRRPAHRASALWVAERKSVIECASVVARLAGDDPTPAVRTRARQTARRLLAEMSRIGPDSLPTPAAAATNATAAASSD